MEFLIWAYVIFAPLYLGVVYVYFLLVVRTNIDILFVGRFFPDKAASLAQEIVNELIQVSYMKFSGCKYIFPCSDSHFRIVISSLKQKIRTKI